MPRFRAPVVAACLSALVVLPAGAPALAAPREGVVLNAGSADAVPGRFIVLMNDTAAAAGVSAQSLAGDDIDRTFASINGFSATMTAREARRLAADPRVRLVEQSRRIRIAGAQRNPVWGLDRIDQRSAKSSRTYTATDDGDSVHAYVIDTGIRVSNTQFGGRASYGYDFVDQDGRADDCDGHGTHVAGTIGGSTYGVAKKVELVAVRVLDCDGEGYTDDVIDGVNWVTENAELPAVANMSVGGGASAALDEAVRESIASGVTYAVAAGNSGANAKNYSPARVSAAITVGATDSADRRASFSNYGSVVDIFAPGVGIKSAYIGGRTATATLSGTSMATPHVAGAAALILDQYPGYSPAKVRDLLIRNATTGKISGRGSGSPDKLLFVPAPPAATKVATSSLPEGSYGEDYRSQLTVASPRTGTWSVSAGSLPEGVELSESGLLTGAPTETGTFTFTVRFTDFVPQAATRSLSIKVTRTPPAIAADALPSAILNGAYAGQLATADDRPGTWSVDPASLPAGFTVTEDGQVTGTPATSGTLSFPVTFTDDWGQTVTATVTLLVVDGDPIIVEDSLPTALSGAAYSAQLTTVDGREGTWSFVDGQLPDGLELTLEGWIIGTTDDYLYGDYEFTVEFTDPAGNTATASFAITVDYDDEDW